MRGCAGRATSRRYEARQSFADIAFYMPWLHEPASLLDYLPEDGLLVLHDDASVRQTAEQLAEQGEEVRERLEREGENPPGLRPSFISWATLRQELADKRQVRFAGLLSDEGIDATPEGSALAPDMLPATSYGGRLRAFAQDVRKLLLERQRVVVVSAQARRVAEFFGDEALLGPNGVLLVSPATDLPDPPRRRLACRCARDISPRAGTAA